MDIIQELVVKTAERLGINEDVVYNVVMWQFKELKHQVQNNVSIEVTGIGKFTVRYARLKAKVEKLEKILKGYEKDMEEKPSARIQKKIDSVREEVAFLKEKMNSDEFQTYIRRMEKSFNSKKGIEGENTGNSEPASGDM